MSKADLTLLAGLAALGGCGTADVHPLSADQSRARKGLTHGSTIGVLNLNPFAEASAEASVRRAARDTCGLTRVPSAEDIHLEGGPAGVSVFIGAMLSYAFKCPESGAIIQ